MVDLLIREAVVLDGTGDAGRPADVEVTGNRITAIRAPGRGSRGRRTIIAQGRVLSPGFIDLHAHSDLQILANPDHTAKVSQGVTCEVLGQDGLSFAPVDEVSRELIRRQIVGWNGDSAGIEQGWHDVAGYLDRLDAGIACHAAYLVPQGTVRMLVVGPDDRPATGAELARMVGLVRLGLNQGAVGLSAGLTYVPGMYADTAELVALCRVVGELGGYFAPHHRSYGRGTLEAYAEMITIARVTGCSLHLTHATLNFPENRGRAPQLLAMIDAALADGVDVTLDSYPYLPGATTLAALLPSWAAAGGPDALLARLVDPAVRARIAEDLDRRGSDGCHGYVVDWSTIEISGVGRPELGRAVGRTVAELAAERRMPPAELCMELLREDRLATSILQHIGNEENVRAIMQHRVHTGGSDAILVGGKPHPRAWGTFPRYLGHYVRELGVLGLAECVHHLTGRAAARLRLRDRGLVREGWHADLVLFDPATVRDTATFEQPRQPAEGIDVVLVNGIPVIDDGARTDALPGRALRRTQTGTASRD